MITYFSENKELGLWIPQSIERMRNTWDEGANSCGARLILTRSHLKREKVELELKIGHKQNNKWPVHFQSCQWTASISFDWFCIIVSMICMIKFFYCKYLVWPSLGISFLSFYQVVWFFFIFTLGISVSLYGWIVWFLYIFTLSIYVSLIVSSCMILFYFYLGYFPQLLIQLKEATQYAPFDPLHHLHNKQNSYFWKLTPC